MKKLFIIFLLLCSVVTSFAADYETPSIGAQEGSDVTFGSGVFNTTLDDATGDEIAFLLNYTTNKASSGNDTGFEVNMWDTASPGNSNLINLTVNGISKFRVSNVGSLTGLTNITAGGNIFAPNISAALNNTTLRLQNVNFSVPDNAIEALSGTVSNSTGQFNGLVILSNYSTTGTAAATDFLINRAEVAVGSGPQIFIDAQVDDVSMFSVDTAGSLTTSGGLTFSGISSISGNLTMADDEPVWFYDCDATGGDVTVTLPTLADNQGKLIEMKLTSATNGCYFDGNGAETIDGSAGQSITTQYNVISLIAATTEWLIR